MKRVLLIFTVLLVAVVSTACINNLAVQDLNNKAQSFMEQGDYKQAIERLKSSIDLDSNIFETHYNLAVAYSQNENYQEALDEFDKAIKIKSDFPDLYYSLATTQFNIATDLQQQKLKMNEDGYIIPSEINNDENENITNSELTQKEKDYIEELYDSAIQNYESYLKLKPSAKEKNEIESQIKIIEKRKSE